MTTIYVSDKDKLPKRANDDLYVTESTLITAAIDGQVPPWYHEVLDIGAGDDGRWGLIAAGLSKARRQEIKVTGVEYRDIPRPSGYQEFDEWYGNQDFMTWENPLPYGYDLVVSNPPYKYAEVMIRQGFDLLAPGGTMVFLLRLAFQASIGRYNKLWNEIYPWKVGVCSRRPSFYGGGTNGTDYGIFYWAKDGNGNPVGHPRQWGTFLLMYERGKRE